MSIIHKTTLTPTKLELLALWLKTQPWYAGSGDLESLTRVGGFRLDDPAGEVGIEFMVVLDQSTGEPIAYHVPMTYRGAPLNGADGALIGTSEHGVLGRRWLYDATRDLVYVQQLVSLIQGQAEPQAQSVSDTPDHTVLANFDGRLVSKVVGSAVTGNSADSTHLAVEASPADESSDEASVRNIALRVLRVLTPIGDSADVAAVDATSASSGDTYPVHETRGRVTAQWTAADGSRVRSVFAVLGAGAA